jgi:mRNA-degrading endonuclease toxin of MazEF toxin-antitoxin module
LQRGDIYHVDLNPIKGREQAGPRFVLIVSPKAFNVLGAPLVCPITQGGNFARHAGFAVSLAEPEPRRKGSFYATSCVSSIFRRGGRFIEKAPDFIINEVLAKLATIIEWAVRPELAPS